MISIIKLSSGETVITDILSYNDETFDVEALNPLQLTMAEDLEIRKMKMYTSPWLPLFGDKTVVEIRYDHIIAMNEASESMKEYYNESLEELIISNKIEDDFDSEDYRNRIKLEIMKVANTSIH